MPNTMSESEMDSMFDDIGNAKETMAKDIVMQQKKEAEEARSHRPFANNEPVYADDVDLDAMEREIEEELRLAKQGIHVSPQAKEKANEDSLIESDYVLEIKELEPKEETVKEEFTEPMIDTSSPNSPLASENSIDDAQLIGYAIPAAPDVVMPSSDMKDIDNNEVNGTETIDNDLIESSYLIDLSEKPEVPVANGHNDESTAKQDAVLDIETDREEIENQVKQSQEAELVAAAPEISEVLQADMARVKLFTRQESDLKFRYALSIETAKREKTFCTETIMASDWKEASFIAANEFLKRVVDLQDSTIILYASESVANLLNRNAAFGIVDNYSDACAEYIENVRTLAAKKSIRVNASNETNTEVWQLLEAAF